MIRSLALVAAIVTALTGVVHAGLPPFNPTPTAYAPFSTVRPQTQLRQAVAKAKSGQPVVVCIAGDSTITFPNYVPSLSSNAPMYAPAGVNNLDGVGSALINRLQMQNPGVTFNVYNYAIPGSVMSQYLINNQANASAQGLSWYSSSALWYQFPGNTNSCDLMIYSWGLNDNYEVSPYTVGAIISDTGYFASQPGTIWITPPTANPAAGSPYNTSAWQDGFISAGSIIRSVAALGPSAFSPGTTFPYLTQPQGVIDMGLWFQAAVQGLDYTDQISTNALSTLPSTSIAMTPNTGYTFPQVAGDFDISVSFTGQMSAFVGGPAFTIKTCATDGGVNNPCEFIVTPTNATAIGVQYYFNESSTPSTHYLNPTSSSNVVMDFACVQEFCAITVNGITWQQSVKRAIGPFTPQIYYGGTGYPSTATMTITKFAAGAARTLNPVLTFAQAYGAGSSYTASLNASTAQGNATLNFGAGNIPSQWASGQTITDLTQQGAITSGTTIYSVNNTTGAVVMNTATASATGAADVISAGPCAPATGGNCINHLSSYGLNDINRSVLRYVDLCLICVSPVNGIVTPTDALGTGAGTSATHGLTGSDENFNLSLTTGTSPTANAVIDTVTWNVAYTPLTLTSTTNAASLTFASVSANVHIGDTIKDVTTTAAIPANTVVLAKTATTITPSNTVTGILSGDSITSTPSPACQLQPLNPAAQALTGAGAPIGIGTSAGFVLTAGSTALAAATLYVWGVSCPRI